MRRTEIDPFDAADAEHFAEGADALAFQCFMSLVGVCDALGLHVKIAKSGGLEVTGAADRAPDLLALTLDARRLRQQRGRGSSL